MSSGSIWLMIGLCAVVTAAIKAAGPIALGGRELPPRFSAVIVLMAPALLAALVVTATLSEGKDLTVGPDTAGVAVAGAAVWRGANVIAAVLIAMVVTAGIRAL